MITNMLYGGDADRIEANLRNGVLRVKIPRAELAEARTILRRRRRHFSLRRCYYYL
jgi:Hsp20/alpha crystallin family